MKKLKIIFLHNHYPDDSVNNEIFGSSGIIHKQIQRKLKLPPTSVEWTFIGGFINDDRQHFWKVVRNADILITLPENMNYADNRMHWHHAEENMLAIVKKIKQENQKIKIFFFDEAHHRQEEFAQLGEFMMDVHDEILPMYIFGLELAWVGGQ
jgi:hypothetical protein